MKTLAPLVLLMCCPCHIFAAPLAPSMSRDGCCPGHNQWPVVPKHLVAHVGMTSSSCKPRSMIITTVCKRKFCIDPTSDWAKELLANFKKPSATLNPKCPKKKLQQVR